MGLRLVTDDRSGQGTLMTAATQSLPITVGDVDAEAKRRLADLGLQRHHDRARATGRAVPRDVRIRELQIMAIALALANLDPIPDDYCSDSYWLMT